MHIFWRHCPSCGAETMFNYRTYMNERVAPHLQLELFREVSPECISERDLGDENDNGD